jgi:hypothetical protein
MNAEQSTWTVKSTLSIGMWPQTIAGITRQKNQVFGKRVARVFPLSRRDYAFQVVMQYSACTRLPTTVACWSLKSATSPRFLLLLPLREATFCRRVSRAR